VPVLPTVLVRIYGRCTEASVISNSRREVEIQRGGIVESTKARTGVVGTVRNGVAARKSIEDPHLGLRVGRLVREPSEPERGGEPSSNVEN
jgi:hypothetical protein